MASSIIFADIHINTSKFLSYEEQKINLIIDNVNKHADVTNVIFAGDVFDKARPTLLDIKLFYKLIESINKPIEIINGNHDHSVFNFLPEAGFKYYDGIVKRDNFLFIPWTKIHELTDEHKDPNSVAISHARCTIPPHIVEEVDISQFSKWFHTTILGDIHQPFSPYPNVHYTSSPVPIHFSTYKKNATGYIKINNETFEIERHFINDIGKVKLITTADMISQTIMHRCTSPKNLYKLVVQDAPEKLQGIQKYATTNIKIFPEATVSKKDISENIKNVLDQSLEIEDILFEYLRANYKPLTKELEWQLRKNL